MSNHEDDGRLAKLQTDVRFIKHDIAAIQKGMDELKQEVRSEFSQLRADLAIGASRQNQEIENVKKKRGDWRNSFNGLSFGSAAD